MGVERRPVHSLVAGAARPSRVAAAVTEAGLVTDMDLAGAVASARPGSGHKPRNHHMPRTNRRRARYVLCRECRQRKTRNPTGICQHCQDGSSSGSNEGW